MSKRTHFLEDRGKGQGRRTMKMREAANNSDGWMSLLTQNLKMTLSAIPITIMIIIKMKMQVLRMGMMGRLVSLMRRTHFLKD